MKKINPKVLWLLVIIIIVYTLIKSCDYFFDFEKKISHISKDINQSKENNAYLDDIRLENLNFLSKSEPLKILKFDGWIEKTITYQGNEIKKIDEKSLSIIFDFKLNEKSELNKENYGETWAIYYNKGNSIASLISNSNSTIRGTFEIDKDSINKPIELRIKKFNIKNRSNPAKNIGSFIIVKNK